MSKLPIPANALTQHILALGKTRAGKSSKMRLIVERFLDQHRPVTILDPKGDWWGLKSSADGKSAGYPIIIFGSEHARYADVRINRESGKAIAELVATGNRPALIDLKGMTVAERSEFFIDFASAYFKHATGERVLMIDEVHNFAPQGKVPDPQVGMMLHWANRLISEGGGMGITMLSASQRPQKVHKDYATSHETLIACRVFHKLDRDAIADWIDACGDPAIKKEVLGSLAQMPRTDAWVYSPEVNFGPKQITFPMFSTYDSFKPQETKTATKMKGWADVDLSKVEASLAKIVEENKSNDPKALKEELAKTKRELAAALKRPTVAAPSAAPIVDQAAIKKAFQDGVDQANAMNQDSFTALRSVCEDAYGLAQGLSQKLKPATQFRFTAAKPAPYAIPKSASPQGSQAPAKAPILRNDRSAPAARGDGSVTGPEQKILNSLATWRAMGHGSPSNAQVAWLAGYSPSSSAYTNPRGALKAKGMLTYPAPDYVAATDQGEAVAQAIQIDGPLLSHVLRLLTGPEAKILEAAARYPDGASNEQIAGDADYSHISSAYTNPRGSLKSKDLIHYPSPGFVQIASWLQ